MPNTPETSNSTEVVDIAKLEKILAAAIKNKTFGITLADLTTAEKEALKPLLNETNDAEAAKIDPILIEDKKASMVKLALDTRNGLRMLVGEQQYYRQLPRPIKYLDLLKKELLISLDEYDGEVQFQRSHDGYLGDFNIFLMTRPASELNGLGHDVMQHVIVGDERREPSVFTYGRIQISAAQPFQFAKNLEFIRQHLEDAKRISEKIKTMPTDSIPRIIL